MRLLLGLLLVFALAPAPAAAQSGSVTGDDLAGLLPGLILGEIRLPAPGAGLSHAAHFSPLFTNELDNPAVAAVVNFNTQLATQLATFPLGSSSGGFTYEFDPGLGTFRRSTRSFGPAFAERAQTLGRRRMSAGVNYHHVSYDRLAGESLDNGSIRFYLSHLECCTTVGPAVPPTFGIAERPNGTRLSPFFEGDVIQASLRLKAASDTVVFFANYGLTDRWDAGVAVPVVRIELDAEIDADILRLSTSSNGRIHTFVSGDASASRRTYRQSGSSTGLGDIQLRTKYRVLGSGTAALAVGADVRLPTGDADQLLSAGPQTKVFVAGSSGTERFAQHVNIGYTVAAGELPAVQTASGVVPGEHAVPDEFNYVGGVEFVASPRLTLIGDVLGRTLRGLSRLQLATRAFEATQPDGARQTFEFSELAPRSGHVTVLLGAVGAKYNVFGNLLLSANVLFPLNDTGLRTKLGTSVGIDYAF